MASAHDKFLELETRIMQTIALVKSTRQERQNAEKELASALAQIASQERELEQLRRERDLVKNKVESLLENLSELTEKSIV